ncbi:hypothetical protein FHS83_002330 [Rhizomicrobium palustre]|uniref:DUF3553 domain-containing protein n=1 Tax=Rhizomicrobium palustre TaxID=189966 RepID=A0A846N1A5_9PROT|nr:DUF3553 domain-containing protein [Rhizomicrobium palustre]NIK89012.1 hypothetical protein [Rhizomicrobium palustre]
MGSNLPPVFLAPGDWVRLPAAPAWGTGQVQSVVGTKVTVNFEHGGKQVIHTDVSPLELSPADGLHLGEETP